MWFQFKLCDDTELKDVVSSMSRKTVGLRRSLSYISHKLMENKAGSHGSKTTTVCPLPWNQAVDES